jgi:radical SAM-linked protein
VPDPSSSPEPRQRYRLVVARDGGPPTAAQRDIAEAWTSAIIAAGIPVAQTEGDRPKPRISFGAPLPVGMAAEGELIDVILTERWPAWRVREALMDRIPEGWRLIELIDVWLAGPPLAGQVAAADYRIELASAADAPDAPAIANAAAQLLAATSLPRERTKGGGSVTYDLRPLVLGVSIDDGPPVVVRTRTRFHPERGTGRPEEVLAALGDELGRPLQAVSIVRERLVLSDDLGPARD